MKNFLEKFSKKYDNNTGNKIDDDCNINQKDNRNKNNMSNDINSNNKNDYKSMDVNLESTNVENISNNEISLSSNIKNIQIEFDDSDNDDDIIIEIEKPMEKDEAKYKAIINLNQQDKSDTLSHSQLIKQLWNKTEQQTKLERKKIEKIHKEKLEKKILQKEQEQADILDVKEKKKVLKELDEEDLEVIDKDLLKELNDKKEKKVLKRLKKLTSNEIEEYQKVQEDMDLENKKAINNFNELNNDYENNTAINSNEIKEFKYGSTQNIDNLSEFFQASNTETNSNKDDNINIWDKLRKGSPIMSGQSEIWSAMTETAIIEKSNSSLMINSFNKEDENKSDNVKTIKNNLTSSISNSTEKLDLSISDTKMDQVDFEKLVDINGSDEVNIISQSNFIKDNISLNENNVKVQTIMKNNKKEVINIIPNGPKKSNLLMSWLNKSEVKSLEEKKYNNNVKGKLNSFDQKIEDIWDNSDDILLQDKKEVDSSIKDLSFNNQNNINSNNYNINEKDDEYTEENLDDNINNYLSDDSFDIDNILPTQSEINDIKVKKLSKIDNDNDDDDYNIVIPKIKKKKRKEKSMYLEDEAVESEDEELKNLGIVKDKVQDEEEDEESDSDIVYSGDEDEINENDVEKIIELHRKQMKDKDEKDMSAIINGVTTGNFRKRKRLDDEELGKGYDLSDDDLDIHGLKSLRKFVNSIDPSSHKRKRYKHKGALAVYASKIETAPFAKCFEINNDCVEILEETNNFSDFELVPNESEEIIDDNRDEENDGEIDQLNREIEELKSNTTQDGDYMTLTIKKFEPSKITRKESTDLKEIENNMNEITLKRANSSRTVDDFINTTSINHEFDILKYINKSFKDSSENNERNNQLFEEPDIIDPLLVQYRRKTPRIGSLMNKNEEELERLRKFDSNLELGLGNGRRNVIGGMLSINSSSSMKSEMNGSENDNENIKLKERNDFNSSLTKTSVKPIGLLKAISRINSNIF